MHQIILRISRLINIIEAQLENKLILLFYISNGYEEIRGNVLLPVSVISLL